MDQARAGILTIQLARPEKSSGRVVIGVRRIESEENRCPNNCLTSTREAPQRCPLKLQSQSTTPYLIKLDTYLTQTLSPLPVEQTPSFSVLGQR